MLAPAVAAGKGVKGEGNAATASAFLRSGRLTAAFALTQSLLLVVPPSAGLLALS